MKMTVEEKIRRRLERMKGHYGNYAVWCPDVLRIAPAWARQIYRGDKTWEFRKSPLRLHRPYMLFETAPEEAITGEVAFSEVVGTDAAAILEVCRRAAGKLPSRPGRGLAKFLAGYAKPHETVYAHFIVVRRIFARPLRAGAAGDMGAWLDVPRNPLAAATVSFPDIAAGHEFIHRFNDGEDLWAWDPPEAVEKALADLEARKEAAR